MIKIIGIKREKMRWENVSTLSSWNNKKRKKNNSFHYFFWVLRVLSGSFRKCSKQTTPKNNLSFSNISFRIIFPVNFFSPPFLLLRLVNFKQNKMSHRFFLSLIKHDSSSGTGCVSFFNNSSLSLFLFLPVDLWLCVMDVVSNSRHVHRF